MKAIAKGLAVFVNLCTYGVGIAVLLIKLLKQNFIAVFIISGLNYNESLFFNMILFSVGTALLGIVLTMLAGEYEPKKVTVEFPVIWALLPAAVGLFFVYFGIKGDAARETVIMIIGAVVYIAASLVNIYCGTKIFTLFPKNNKE
ncbi:MAG: hypothetical protein IKF64_08645 [Eubacterium sp.]|nr:hypothetical protein [Eubacterium sp.]